LTRKQYLSRVSPDLRAHGYASLEADARSTQAWLEELGMSLPPGLSVTPLQWMVSPRLLTSKTLVDRVLKDAGNATGLHTLFDTVQCPLLLQAPVPVTTADDAEWLAWPGRYSVARKCDGTRHLLVVAADGVAYFRSSSGFVYQYPIILDCRPGGAQKLPPGTVLDGELVWVGRQGFFVASDAVSLGDCRVWQQPLLGRVSALAETLQLVEAEASASLREAAARQARISELSITPEGRIQRFCKKQQAPAPGLDTVTVVMKRQVQVSAAALSELEASQSGCPYPTTGLVFTPNEVSYLDILCNSTSGMPMIWSVTSSLSGKISVFSENRGLFELVSREYLLSELTYEFQPCSPISAELVTSTQTGGNARSQWFPASICWDKIDKENLRQVDFEQALDSHSFLPFRSLKNIITEVHSHFTNLRNSSESRYNATPSDVQLPSSYVEASS
jgi:hypothetical protein